MGRARSTVVSVVAAILLALWMRAIACISLDDERLRSAQADQSSADVGYLHIDGDNRIVGATERAKELLGDREISSNSTISSVLPAADDSWFESNCATGEQRITVDGRSLGVRSEPFITHDGDDTSLVVIRETASTAEELQQCDLLDALPMVSVILDEDLQITALDPSIEDQFGCPVTHLEGDPIFRTIHAGDEEGVRAALERLVAGETRREQFDFRVETHDGTWRMFDGVARNLIGQHPFDGIVLGIRDITERNQRRHVLEQQNKRLEEFAEIVSHDIRSPLQVASGNLERVAPSGDSDAIENVRQAHERIETIIDDVLTLARQGRSVGDLSPTSLATVAQTAWETVETDDMTLIIDFDLEIAADPDRLQQLMENLFRNVGDHAGQGTTVTVGPLDSIGTTTRIAESLTTGFYVEDDGPGIPEADRDRIFDSGFTSDADGTGFGLAIVAQIATAHAWHVDVTEGRSGGARFEFREGVDDEQLTPAKSV